MILEQEKSNFFDFWVVNHTDICMLSRYFHKILLKINIALFFWSADFEKSSDFIYLPPLKCMYKNIINSKLALKD